MIKFLKKTGLQDVIALIVILVGIVVIMSLSSNLFLSPRNLTNLLIDSTTVGIIAVFSTMLMIAGGLDLSVASTAALCGVIIGVFQASLGILPAVLIALAVGAMVGLVNGVLVTYVGINPLITTLGMFSIARGLAFVFSNGLTIPVFDLSGEHQAAYDKFTILSEGSFLGLPYPVIAMLVLFALGLSILHLTSYGRAMYAIGGNELAAKMAALPVKRYRVTAYVLSGLSAAIAAIFLTSRLYAADPRAAPGVELTVITAVILGGTSLAGGKGNLVGTFLGVMILSTLLNGLRLQSTSTDLQNIIQGLVLLAAVGFEQIRTGNVKLNIKKLFSK